MKRAAQANSHEPTSKPAKAPTSTNPSGRRFDLLAVVVQGETRISKMTPITTDKPGLSKAPSQAPPDSPTLTRGAPSLSTERQNEGIP